MRSKVACRIFTGGHHDFKLERFRYRCRWCGKRRAEKTQTPVYPVVMNIVDPSKAPYFVEPQVTHTDNVKVNEREA